MNEIKEKLRQAGISILSLSRNELYVSMRFLDIALASLKYEMNLSTKTIGTDGVSILFNPRYLMDMYQSDRVLVNRAYLHMLLHNIFCHDFSYKDKNLENWNLACDIAAESIIDSMESEAVRITVSDYREYIYGRLKKEMRVLNAQSIYHYLMNTFISQREFDRMCQAFIVDDHKFWEHDEQEQQNQEQQQQRQEDWQDISEKMQTNMQTISSQYGDMAGDLLACLELEHRERYNYRDFLKHFAAWGEEIVPDEDSFDYILYTYGMEHYKNMPFIEPLEYKDVKKIDEFIIAIDTSESCPPETVKIFLEETFSMLSDRESFFKKVNIHLIQCDAGISSDTVICDAEGLAQFMNKFQVSGFGGTDFRPVFDYTSKLIEDGVFTHLKGLIYFTDGYGEFPAQRPPYETAFVLIGDEAYEKNVPSWAIKLVLDIEDLKSE